VLREHAPQLYVAALLAVLGGVLLVAMSAVLVTRAVDARGHRGVRTAASGAGRMRDHADLGCNWRRRRVGGGSLGRCRRRAGTDGTGLARTLAQFPGVRSADTAVHRHRSAGVGACTLVPAMGQHPGLDIGRCARRRHVHRRPARCLHSRWAGRRAGSGDDGVVDSCAERNTTRTGSAPIQARVLTASATDDQGAPAGRPARKFHEPRTGRVRGPVLRALRPRPEAPDRRRAAASRPARRPSGTPSGRRGCGDCAG